MKVTIEWKPIGSAPKDGTTLLLVKAGFQPTIGQYVRTPGSGKFVLADPDDFDSMDAWSAYVSDHDYVPTHWALLPEAPTEPAP